jgi:hypothetical protein
MTGNVALDVVIGLTFIYVLYSLFTTIIVELVAANLQLRARTLKRAIERMLDDDKVSFSGDFYKTPLIKYLASGRVGLFGVNDKPSYLKAKNFSEALLYLLKKNETPGEAVAKIRATLSKDPNSETCKYLLFLLDEASNDIDKFIKMAETWFDDTMERCAGWYKRKATYITLIVGFLMATLFNVDTFQIVNQLSKDPKAREQYVQMAAQALNNPAIANSTPKFDSLLRKRLLSDAAFFRRVGKDTATFRQRVEDSVYQQSFKTKKEMIARMDTLYQISKSAQSVLSFKRTKCPSWFFDSWINFLGCLVTAIALSLGAPFWFDLLNKLMKLRSSIAVPPASENKQKTSPSEEVTPNAVG